MNKVKGNIKVNLVNAPTYGINKKDTLSDLAMLTGNGGGRGLGAIPDRKKSPRAQNPRTILSDSPRR